MRGWKKNTTFRCTMPRSAKKRAKEARHSERAIRKEQLAEALLRAHREYCAAVVIQRAIRRSGTLDAGFTII